MDARPETRSELAGGRAFLDAVRGEGFVPSTLTGWIDAHLVSPGRMLRPTVVRERGAGWVDLRGPLTRAQDVSRVSSAAAATVLAALRGLVSSPQDDRFLAGAVFANRVRRTSTPREARWIARPRPTDDLSAIVLSLFAVDVLHHRETYEATLSVCDVCDRVGFDASRWQRRCCRAHSQVAPASGARTAPLQPHRVRDDLRRAG